MFLFLGKQIDNIDILGIGKEGLGESLFDLGQALLGKLQHFGAFTEGHGAGGTGLDADGHHAGLQPVDAIVALGELAGFVVPAGDVVRADLTDGLAVFGAQGSRAIREEHGTCLGVLDDGSLKHHVGHVLAGRNEAVTALFGEEVPVNDLVLIEMFAEADNLEIVGVQVRGVLMGTCLLGLICRKVVPLFASDLTAPTCSTPCCINKNALGHSCSFSGSSWKRTSRSPSI